MTKKRARTRALYASSPRKQVANDSQSPANAFGIKNPEAFAMNLARMIEEAGKAASAYLKPREQGEVPLDFSDSLTGVMKTLAKVGEYWMAEPGRTLEAQNRLFAGYLALWAASMNRVMGEPAGRGAPPAKG